MFAAIEQKLTSILGDDLSARAHLDVLEAPAAAAAPNPGRGTVLVSVAKWTPAARFERGRFSFAGTQSRRVQPIHFEVNVDCLLRPAGPSPAELAAARELLLVDTSLVSHGLARPELQSGQGFAIADPDPGFQVLSFELADAAVDRDPNAAGALAARLHYRGDAEIWPPGVTQQEGEILAIDVASVALPLELTVANPVLRAGQTSVVRARALPASRVDTRTPPARAPLRLAVTVLSDAPPAQRGTIGGGVPGLETGFRLIDVTPPLTSIDYRAPAAGIGRARVERVAVHLATPDGHRGVLLGSAAVRLEPG